jgi:outer membrane protein assembly factor BamB
MSKVTVGLLSLVLAGAALAAAPENYHLLKTIPVSGDGGWDYVYVDPAARRVYVSHATQVDVLDADSGEVKGKIADTAGVHGIAVAPGLGRGFTSNGRSNNVTIFDVQTLKPLGTVATGRNPDCIIYEPVTRRVFAFNGNGASATVIDAADGKVAGTIALEGKPEFAAADTRGHVFVNLEDKNEVLRLDARNLKVLDRWPIAPAKTPVSLAMDAHHNRLFVGCRSKMLVVMDADNGKVVATGPIGDRVDAGAYDPETKLVFNSCGDGTVSVFRQESPDTYSPAATIKTRPGSKTMSLDPKTHRLFLPAVEYRAADAGKPKARPTPVPGSFAVLVFGP